MALFTRKGNKDSSDRRADAANDDARAPGNDEGPAGTRETHAAPAPQDPFLPTGEDMQRQIATAAYYRWLARGGRHDGQGEKDWYDAEAELRAQGTRNPPL